MTILRDEKKTFSVDRVLLCNQINARTGTPQASQILLTAVAVFPLVENNGIVCLAMAPPLQPFVPMSRRGSALTLIMMDPVFLMCLSQGKIIAPIFTTRANLS